MASAKLKDSLFYSLEKAIKTYRQFAQRQITSSGFDITIDQWLVLKILQDSPGITQQDLAVSVFKDYASITRIIELLVQKEYLSRTSHTIDKRRFHLVITKEGATILELLTPIIKENRSVSLNGIPEDEIENFHATLLKIINNAVNRSDRKPRLIEIVT